MLVKICGLTSAEEAGYVNTYGADMAGVVLFFPRSKRDMDIGGASKILAALSPRVRSVAVMVSPDYRQALMAEELGFDYLQIHGQIDGRILEDTHTPILKAFNIKDLDQWERYVSHPRIAGCVLDAAEPGSGAAYDWGILRDLPRGEGLFLLAGGLHPGNVAAAIAAVHPDGVDVSSGVERASGRGKDPARIQAFIRAAKRATP